MELSTGIISACVPAFGPLIYRLVRDRTKSKSRKQDFYRVPIVKEKAIDVAVVSKGSDENWSETGTNSGVGAGEVTYSYDSYERV